MNGAKSVTATSASTAPSHPPPHGTVVTVTPSPATGSTFMGWSGDMHGQRRLCRDDERGEERHRLLQPQQLCPDHGDGRHRQRYGHPRPGGWVTATDGGHVTHTPPPAPPSPAGRGHARAAAPVSTMNGAKSVTALQPQQLALTTATAGTGSGSVTLDPAGGTYSHGTVVTVTPTPGHRLHLHRLERRLHGQRRVCRDDERGDERHRQLQPQRLSVLVQPADGRHLGSGCCGDLHRSANGPTHRGRHRGPRQQRHRRRHGQPGCAGLHTGQLEHAADRHDHLRGRRRGRRQHCLHHRPNREQQRCELQQPCRPAM